MNKNSPFNIINLDVKEGSFDKAFERWKFYKISGFKTPKVRKITFRERT